MISKTLSTSVCFARLFDRTPGLAEFAQSLYPLLMAHSDDFGREQGDVLTVKYRMHPRSPRSEEDFSTAMASLNDVGLIHWYTAKGRECYQIVKFDEHQTGLHKRTRSTFPPFPGSSGNGSEVPAQLKRTEEKRTKGNLIERKGREQNTTTDVVGFSFAEFWQAYPRKENRPAAEKAFKKISPDRELLTRILSALIWQSRQEQWRKEDGKFIPHPASWINGRRWEDERTIAPERPPAPDWRDECAREHGSRCTNRTFHEATKAAAS